MKLDDAMRAELLYRQEQFLEEAHLDPVGFGNRYGISTKNMQRVFGSGETNLQVSGVRSHT